MASFPIAFLAVALLVAFPAIGLGQEAPTPPAPEATPANPESPPAPEPAPAPEPSGDYLGLPDDLMD